MKTSVTIVFVMLYALLVNLKAATITSTSSGGNWSAGGTWSGGVRPASGDAVLIASGATVTVDGIFTCLSVTFTAGTSNNLVISGTNSLTVTNDIVYSNPSASSAQTVNVGAGTLICTNLTMFNNTSGRTNTLTISTGSFTASGNISMPGNTTRNFFTCTDTAIVTVGGSWTNSGLITPSTATFIFNGSTAQSVPGLTYNRLWFSGAGTKTITPASGSIVCSDTFRIAAGSIFNNSGSGSLTTNGVFYIEGEYIESNTSGNVNINGMLFIASGGELSCTVSENLVFTDSIIVNGSFSSSAAGTRSFAKGLIVNGSFDAGTGACTFASNNLVIGGVGLKEFGGNVTITGITVYNYDSVTIAGTLGGNGTFVNSTDTSYAGLNGNVTITTLTAPGVGNTVVYGRASSLTMPSTTAYHNLIISGAAGSAKTLSNNITVNGDLTIMSDGNLNVSTSNYSITLYGNFINDGVFAPRTATSNFTMAGTSQNISGAASTIPFNILTINSGSTTTLVQDISLVNTLNVNSGGVLDLDTYSANRTAGGGTITVAGSLLLKATSGGQTGSNFPLNFTTVTLTGGTVNYNANGGGQTVYATTYNNLTLGNSSGSHTLAGNTTISGALTFSGGKLALGSNTLALNSTLSGMTSTSCFSANASSSLSIGGTGALGTNVYFDQTTPGTTNRLTNFTYDRTSQTITLGDTVEITGMVTPTAGLLATSDKLKLISNATGDAGILEGSGSYISGAVTVQRYIPSSGRRWRFLSSPSVGATLADWQTDIYITGSGGATNGFDATVSNQAGVYSYNEAATGDLNQGWTEAGNITDALTPGKGFRIFVRGDRSPGRLDGSISTQNAVTLKIVKSVTSGDVNMLPTYTSTGVLANDGWNLMGNPYPCAIDWNAFHDAGRTGSSPNYSGTDYQKLDAVVYVIDPGGASTAYTSYNAFSGAVVGDLAGGIIPSGAAFWVKAAAASPAMTMKEMYKTSTAAGSVFKSVPENVQFSVKVLKDGLIGDETVVKYVEETTEGLDAYDIAKMYGMDINISSIGNDGSFLAANYKPFNGESDTIVLSLGFSESGHYELLFNEPQNMGIMSNLTVYLWDVYNNTFTDLRRTHTYPFDVDINTRATLGSERFKIIVGALATGLEEKNADGNSGKFSLYPSISSGPLTILATTQTSVDNLSIETVDPSGKTISVIKNPEWNGHQFTMNLSAYQPGLYLIRIVDGNRVVQTLKSIRQ